MFNIMQPQGQPGQANNNYLQMMMNFLRQMQQQNGQAPNVPAPITQGQNVMGNYGMTGQAIGQPMSKPQASPQGGSGSGVWSSFHNVMQNNGNLARTMPAPQSGNAKPVVTAPTPVQSQQAPVYNDPTKPFPFVNNNSHIPETLAGFEKQKADWAAGKMRLR